VAEAPGFRFYYVDDSGAEVSGYIVYAWIECVADAWNGSQRRWVDLRAALYTEFGIPPSVELHASPFLNGRGNPSLDPAWNRVKRYRRQVFEQVLYEVGTSPGLRVGAVYRQIAGTGRAYHDARVSAYRRLVAHFQARLAADDAYGMVMMDGDGSDPTYARAHRDLDLRSRRLLEDPFFKDSQHALWIQLADIVAYTAYQSLHRGPGKSFMWEWYDKYLRGSDVNGGPLRI
jgi:hypothetical protein